MSNEITTWMSEKDNIIENHIQKLSLQRKRIEELSTELISQQKKLIKVLEEKDAVLDLLKISIENNLVLSKQFSLIVSQHEN